MNDRFAGYIRVKAICVFSQRDRLLAIDSYDPTKQKSFWVPVGGRVEFGETAEQAVIREVTEELSEEITNVRLLGVLENLFTFDGGAGHEIVFVYDAAFADAAVYDQQQVLGSEGKNPFTAHWIEPVAPTNGWPLYPEGLADLLSDQQG